MKATILLLSVDEAPMLEHSLPAALAQGPIGEVVVVDNACTDATAQLARRHRVRLLALPERMSYAAAINRAIAQTAEEAVLLLNADCFLEPGFLEAALARLHEPGVGSVAPKLLRASGPGQPLGQVDAAGMFIDRRRKNGLTGHGSPEGTYQDAAEVFGADGAAALYRRATLEACALGGTEVLDEDMGLWASDADLAWRARLLGWRSVYEPRARALHVRTYSPSTRSGLPESARALQFRNRLLMIAKNETRAGLLRHGLVVFAYELAALGYVLARERHLLGGYRDAWRLRHGAWRRRARVQASRSVALVPFGLRAPR